MHHRDTDWHTQALLIGLIRHALGALHWEQRLHERSQHRGCLLPRSHVCCTTPCMAKYPHVFPEPKTKPSDTQWQGSLTIVTIYMVP